MTPLHVAVDRAYIGIVKYLVGRGADINIQDDNGVNICMSSCRQIDLMFWKQLSAESRELFTDMTVEHLYYRNPWDQDICPSGGEYVFI